MGQILVSCSPLSFILMNTRDCKFRNLVEFVLGEQLMAMFHLLQILGMIRENLLELGTQVRNQRRSHQSDGYEFPSVYFHCKVPLISPSLDPRALHYVADERRLADLVGQFCVCDGVI